MKLCANLWDIVEPSTHMRLKSIFSEATGTKSQFPSAEVRLLVASQSFPLFVVGS